MTRFHRCLLALVCVAMAAHAAAQPKPPELKPPPALPSVDSFFSSLKNRVIDGANHVDAARREVQAAATKRSSDFSCANSAAQGLYDQTKQRRDSLTRTRDAAQQAENDTNTAFENCKRAGLGEAVCRTGYNDLPFAGIKHAAQMGVNEGNTALNLLKNLKCVEGCNRSVTVAFPAWHNDTSLVAHGQIPVGGGVFVPMPMVEGRPVGSIGPQVQTSVLKPEVSARGSAGPSVTPSAEVCTDWDAGSASLAVAGANGDLNAEVRARLPKCRRTTTLAPEVCKAWNASVLLPQLVAANLVPPQLTAGHLTVDVPSAPLRIVQGLEPAACNQPVRICTRLRGEATLSFDTGADPLQALRSVSDANCGQHEVMGCAQPALGIAPKWTELQLPDLRRGVVRWSSPSLKPGSAHVDLSDPRFRVACGRWEALSLPTFQVRYSVKTQATPLCTEPRFVNLVSQP